LIVGITGATGAVCGRGSVPAHLVQDADAKKKHEYLAIAMSPADHLRRAADKWAKLGF